MNTKIDTPQGLEVIFREKEIISYAKSVKVAKDGETFIADLRYDNCWGYEILWSDLNGKEVEEPKWATEYADLTSYHELAYMLDEMGAEQ
jgi:hypothetical protein